MNPPFPAPKLPPVPLIKIVNTIRAFLVRFNRRMYPGNVVLYEQFQNFWLLPALYVAAKFDFATLLQAKPLTAEEISALRGLDPSAVSRVMRALAGEGIFRMTREGKYALNARSKGLLEEQGSLRYMILHHLGPVNWNLMSNLEYAVRTGKDAFTEKYGKPTYEYLREHPGENLLFDRSMSNLSDLGLAPILQVYNFSKYAVISDIGGGEGFLLANILQCNPGCRGILFDTPHALEKAPEMMNRYGVIDRTEIIAGDFFQSVPATGELTILKNIVHNWSDQKATGLLTVIHRSMKPGAVLLILEMVVPAGNEPSLAKLLDIQMMATMEGGKERTAAEYRELLENSGFTFRRIIPTISPVSLIEAVRK